MVEDARAPAATTAATRPRIVGWVIRKPLLRMEHVPVPARIIELRRLIERR
jgi:hypothetical protein